MGAAVAAGIHTVLVLAMLVRGRFCLPCGVAAALAAALFLVVLARSNARAKMVVFAYLPALILALAPAVWALARERAAEHGREAFICAVQGRGLERRLSIQVFEQDHCGYCQRPLYSLRRALKTGQGPMGKRERGQAKGTARVASPTRAG